MFVCKARTAAFSIHIQGGARKTGPPSRRRTWA